MPGFHNHQGESTYYFVPRRHGQFHTYQIQDLGAELVLGQGYEDGDRVPWDVFYTLNDLGLLYFKQSDDDPQATAPAPDDVEFDLVDDLSLEQRCAFVAHVLDNYHLATIESDTFMDIVLSVEDAPRDCLEPVLDALGTNTPFDTSGVFHAAETEGVSPLLVGCLLHYWFDALDRDAATTREYLDYYRSQHVHYDGTYSYYVQLGQTEDAPGESDPLQVQLPAVLATALDDCTGDEAVATLFTAVTWQLEQQKFRQELGEFGEVLIAGVAETDETHLALAPIAPPANSSEASSTDDSAATTEGDALAGIVSGFREDLPS